MATHCEKIRHFEKKFQSALNLGPTQPTLKKKIQSAINLGPTWQYVRKTEWQTAVNIDFCLILKKPQAYPLKVFSESMIKTTLLSLQIYVQKYPKAVGGWEKRWQNLCRTCFNFHDTNHLYPTNIASKTWQMNVQLIKSSINYLKI